MVPSFALDSQPQHQAHDIKNIHELPIRIDKIETQFSKNKVFEFLETFTSL